MNIKKRIMELEAKNFYLGDLVFGLTILAYLGIGFIFAVLILVIAFFFESNLWVFLYVPIISIGFLLPSKKISRCIRKKYLMQIINNQREINSLKRHL
jgi:pilus assembly protein TadC